jgi:hypothetical protein
MHDDGEPARQCDPRRAHSRTPTDVECPVLEHELAPIAEEHDVRRLVEQRTDAPVTAVRDAAGIVDLTGLVTPWHQVQIGTA